MRVVIEIAGDRIEVEREEAQRIWKFLNGIFGGHAPAIIKPKVYSPADMVKQKWEVPIPETETYGGINEQA
jgi:hypothetical protein